MSFAVGAKVRRKDSVPDAARFEAYGVTPDKLFEVAQVENRAGTLVLHILVGEKLIQVRAECMLLVEREPISSCPPTLGPTEEEVAKFRPAVEALWDSLRPGGLRL